MKDCKIIVALTTYKGRIYNPKFPVCLRSIINQKTKIPFKVVLVLSTEEFKNKNEVPEDIRLMDRHHSYEEVKGLKRLHEEDIRITRCIF